MYNNHQIFSFHLPNNNQPTSCTKPSSQPNQHQGIIQDVDLVYHQPDGQTSPAVPDDVPLPTGFLQLSTCAENRSQHPAQKNLDCKPSMWLNPFAQPDALPPFRHTSRRLTSLRREQTIAVMHQLHSCHLPNRRQPTSCTTT